MSSIPAGIGRVPNLLQRQLSLANLTRTNLSLLNVQEQLSTMRQVNRVSDDAVKAAMIGVLDDRLERSGQRQRNIEHARAALGDMDNSLGEVNTLALDAKEIAASMASTGFSANDRASQAIIVDQLLSALYSQANRTSVAGHIYGGSQPGVSPVREFRGGYRFVASGAGVTADLGLAAGVPITLGPNNPVGATSARVRGAADLDPDLTMTTRLADLRGARGLGVSLGTVNFSFNGGPNASIDLSGADTIQNVADRITAAIRQYETDQGVTVLGPGGVGVSGESLSIDVVAGGALRFADIPAGVTAKDLGLAAETPFDFTPATPTGVALEPRLNWSTPIASLQGTGGPLGQIRVRSAGGSAVVDLSSATTLEDVRNRIEGTGLGLRVVINDAGTGIDVLTEVAGTRAMAMSIEEVTGNNSTATRLGIRTFAGSTRISELNDGRGVSVVDGVTNPTTGLPDPTLNSDFSITLGDGAATRITIDLTPGDLTTVQNVVDRMNAQISAQLVSAGLAPGDLVVSLSPDGNGIRLTQNAAFPGSISIEQLNNSGAARDLGLSGGTYDGSTGSYQGVDAAKVRVNNLFTHLIDLREALRSNDVSGMSIAGEHLDAAIQSLADLRGLVGGYQQRVEASDAVEEDSRTMDLKIRSELRDLDVAEAASRLSLLQTQLQAGMQATSLTMSRTLLDFLM
jgi:flagellin-like hook-associated protein FlgL